MAVSLSVNQFFFRATAMVVLCCTGANADAWTVIVEKESPDDTRFAAWDFENHLAQIATNDANVVFEIGTRCSREKAIGAAGALAPGESAAISDGRTVWIYGEGRTGTANGVYAFLENRLGCRWYTPYDDPVLPRRDLSEVGAFADVNRPKLTERWILTLAGHNQLRRNGMMFQYRNRLNANHWCRYNNVDTPSGMGVPVPEIRCVPPMVHSVFVWLPPKKYFAEHPDWYSMDKNGMRKSTDQLCFASREMRAELTKNILEKVRQEGGEGYFDFSQQDGMPFCRCPGCKALNEKYGTPGGAMFDCLKELGLLLERTFPEVYVHFLAYCKDQTEKPPNELFGRFPDNVIPVFAPIDDDFSKTYRHPNNAGTLENFKRWAKITKKRWVWYYPMPYYANNPPFSAIRRWTADLRMLADVGLTGGCFEHDVGVHIGAGFGDLQSWLIAKLYECPDRPVAPLIEEFCRWYYGAGADEMLQFLVELEKNTSAHGDFLRWQSFIPPSIDERNLQSWASLFDRATAKVESDPVVLQHLNETRLGVDYWTLKRHSKIQKLGNAIESVDSVADRMTNTLARGYARRCPGGDDNAFARAIGHNPQKEDYDKALRAVKGARALASSKSSPLPEQFRNVPEIDLIDLPNLGLDWGRKVQMPDACCGWATWHELDSAPDDYMVGFYDKRNNRFGQSRTFKPVDVVEPDEFHFYRIGVEELSPECYIYPGYSCNVRVNLDEYYEQGVPQKWEVWLSIKFEGPRYKGSKALENRVYYDRVVLVRCHE